MITRDGAKMSKSKGNMISPVPYVERYGADTARCYILFIGPPDHDADWSDKGVEGVHRFLGRLWRLGDDVAEQTGPARSRWGRSTIPDGADLELMRKAHWAIDKVTEDMAGRFAFNTAIAAVMELVNEATAIARRVHPATLHFATATAASLIFPFAPHTGAEVYEMLTGERVWEEPWPAADLGAARARHGRGRAADQRQAARPHPGARGRPREELERLARERRRDPGPPRRPRGRQGRRGARPSWSTSSCAERRGRRGATVPHAVAAAKRPVSRRMRESRHSSGADPSRTRADPSRAAA